MKNVFWAVINKKTGEVAVDNSFNWKQTCIYGTRQMARTDKCTGERVARVKITEVK
jgi:hypothetical protein